MNRRVRNYVTQDSDDSGDDLSPMQIRRRGRLARNIRRGRIIPTIPDDSSTSNSSSTSSPSNKHSNKSSTEQGWLSTRKIRSPQDRVRFRENAKKSLKKTKKATNRPSKFKIGTVVLTVSIGELLPLQPGQKRRSRKRLFGKILRPHASNTFEWLVRFSNGHEGYCRETNLKFDNNDQVTHTLSGNCDTGDLEMSPACSGVVRSTKVVSTEKSNKKNVLDYLARSIINDKE
jgi:hypothetical protein